MSLSCSASNLAQLSVASSSLPCRVTCAKRSNSFKEVTGIRYWFDEAGIEKYYDVPLFKKGTKDEPNYLLSKFSELNEGDEITLEYIRKGDKGFIEWYCNGTPEGDLIRYQIEGQEQVERVFPKKRPDDFYREMGEMARRSVLLSVGCFLETAAHRRY